MGDVDWYLKAEPNEKRTRCVIMIRTNVGIAKVEMGREHVEALVMTLNAMLPVLHEDRSSYVLPAAVRPPFPVRGEGEFGHPPFPNGCWCVVHKDRHGVPILRPRMCERLARRGKLTCPAHRAKETRAAAYKTMREER